MHTEDVLSSGQREIDAATRRASRLWHSCCILCAAIGFNVLPFCVVAADDVGPSPRKIVPSGVDGALVICGGGQLPQPVMDRFMQLAGGDDAAIVVIPTASRHVDATNANRFLDPWKRRKPKSVALLHTRSRDEADTVQFVRPLKQATAVWFGGGSQSRIAEAYVGTAVERELHALLKRGGVIGGTSAGAAVQSRLMIASGNPIAKLGEGFDLLPGSVIDQHFLTRGRRSRLLGVLDEHSGLVGFGIDEGTALIVRGRRLRVLGESTVTVCLAASNDRPLKEYVLESGAIADLTELRRAAISRTLAKFPPEKLRVPHVQNGSLVIVGGGGVPIGICKKFIELAGGPGELIVVLPTALPDPLPQRDCSAAMFRRAGAKNVKVLRGRKLQEVESPEFLKTLKQARGIWFGDGRQWRFVDAYEGTKAYNLLHDVLGRGGVVGGSSAGASIQAEYLVRGSPMGNRKMMAEGYERGFAFLPGTAIDQHFSRRKRFHDMTAVTQAHPQLLGLGIDESTALIVQGHIAEVVGKNKVHFYDRSKPVTNGKPDYESVESGQRYDLQARAILEAVSRAH